MSNQTIEDAERRMKKAVEVAQHDYSTLRTGRANPLDSRGDQGGLLRHADTDQPGCRDIDAGTQAAADIAVGPDRAWSRS